MGVRYRNFFVLFDASLPTKPDRIFKLCLPARKIERALYPIKVPDAHTAKITFIKKDRGEIDITNIEVVK